jgi:hypothetical protein
VKVESQSSSDFIAIIIRIINTTNSIYSIYNILKEC